MAETDTGILAGLYEQRFGIAPAEVTPLAGAGSNRRYYLLTASDVASDGTPHEVVGTVGTDSQENEAFIYLSGQLAASGLSIPEVYAVSDDHMAYLQQYIGSRSLFSILEEKRLPDGGWPCKVEQLMEKSIRMIARIGYKGGKQVDFNKCFPQPAMDASVVNRDLNYFKYCFLKVSGVEFSEARFDAEMQFLSDCLLARINAATTFMARDFQSRNVMLTDMDEPVLIDFQGGMRGPVEYDVASFLWQARARIPHATRMRMIEVYLDEAERVDPMFDRAAFMEALPYFVLFRMLQTLGAYGFRGWTERRPHFLRSIPAGVSGLQALLSDDAAFGRLHDDFPYLCELAGKLAASPKVSDLAPLGTLPDFNGLTLVVSSFSYKRGVPYDLSGNGGGFVFDCRAVHNPGRYAEYKSLRGVDAPVIDFLEKNGEIFPFLNECEALVDASLQRYIKRGFTSLNVSFGCTGGQHRSVYSAEALGHWAAERYPHIRVVIHHREQRLFTVLNPS